MDSNIYTTYNLTKALYSMFTFEYIWKVEKDIKDKQRTRIVRTLSVWQSNGSPQWRQNKMSEEGIEVSIEHKRKCVFCGDPAIYEGETLAGDFCDMCDACYQKYGTGFGIGTERRIVKKVEE